MAAVGLTPERLRRMARTEEALAEPPAIWPGMPYAEQQRCAKRLQEIEAFGLARLWRVLAQDHDRVSQRVVVARGIEWRSELQDRVFIYTATEPKIPKGLPVLLLDADHDPLIGAATLPTNRRTVIRPTLNAEVVQVRDTACSKNKLLELARRAGPTSWPWPGTRPPRAAGCSSAPTSRWPTCCGPSWPKPNISIAHFGAIRGLDGWKDFDTVIVAGREQPPAADGGEHGPVPVRRRRRTAAAHRRVRAPDARPPHARTAPAPPSWCRFILICGCRPSSSRSANAKSSRWWGGCAWCTGPRRRGCSCCPTCRRRCPSIGSRPGTASYPSKMEQAIVAGRGVLPLSACRAGAGAPQLCGPRRRRSSDWQRRKGGQVPIRDLYWNVTTLSAATLVSYRRPGQTPRQPAPGHHPRQAVTEPNRPPLRWSRCSGRSRMSGSSRRSTGRWSRMQALPSRSTSGSGLRRRSMFSTLMRRGASCRSTTTSVGSWATAARCCCRRHWRTCCTSPAQAQHHPQRGLPRDPRRPCSCHPAAGAAARPGPCCRAAGRLRQDHPEQVTDGEAASRPRPAAHCSGVGLMSQHSAIYNNAAGASSGPRTCAPTRSA